MIFSFRKLQEDDLPMLCDWLNRPHLQEWWSNEPITLPAVRRKYLPRIITGDTAIPFLAVLEEQPVGYIQYYDAFAGDHAWWPDRITLGVIGIDQFIAVGDSLGKGLGTAMISTFAAERFQDPSVTEIRVDPNPQNHRAIRCYAKVGFRKVDEIMTPDGPAIMMAMAREDLRTPDNRVPCLPAT